MDLQDVPEFYSNNEQPPRKFFLRDISLFRFSLHWMTLDAMSHATFADVKLGGVLRHSV